MTELATLLTTHASLPEPRQPAWGLAAGDDAIQRAHADRVAAIMPLLQALPCTDTLRILDLDCAQGYFTLAIAHALAACGRKVDIVGVDRNAENVRFCETLAAHHGIHARFVCAPLAAEFIREQGQAVWDAVLVFGTRSPGGEADAALAEAAPLLLAHARVTLCEGADDRGPPATAAGETVCDRLLAAHAFARRIARFAALPGGATCSLFVGSERLAWVGDRWFEFDHVADRSHPAIPDTFAGQRRVFVGADAVVKAFRGDGRHGGLNREALAAEAAVLQALPSELARYPALLAQADDGDTVWLARAALPGTLLSDQIAAGGIDRDAVARGLIAELAQLEALGFQHGELRCWNVLVSGDVVRLIGFGAMVHESSPLPRLALAAMLLELAEGQVGHEQPFYASVHPVAAYPTAWQPLVRYLLGVPQGEFSYAQAQRIVAASLEDRSGGVVASATSLEPDAELVSAAAQEHCDAFRRLRQHDEALERALGDAERARAAELDELVRLRASVRELERERSDGTAPLKVELKTSQAYATSLEATLERERTDARTALDAVEAARRVAVDYSDSLKQALDESKRRIESLVREAEQLAWMRHRFRWLKPLWPRQPEDPRDKE